MLHNTAVYILPARLYTLRLFISLLLSYILYLLEEEEEEEKFISIISNACCISLKELFNYIFL